MAVETVATSESGETRARVAFGTPYRVETFVPAPSVLLVCEHASRHIPHALNGLGVGEEAQMSHVAWDPGALGVADALARSLPSVLVTGTVSRLVYDCNRPPDAESAIPARSEVVDIPGNQNLSAEERAARIDGVYRPFAKALASEIATHRATLALMVTIHSFTPVFHGVAREVEIGVLHGLDPRFADAMMAAVPDDARFTIRLNEPYAARDGVAHTLDTHGARNDLPNVMIEVRNDLIETVEDQEAVAAYLADWITSTLERFA